MVMVIFIILLLSLSYWRIDYDDRKTFVQRIQKFYTTYKIPEYCKGTIQDGKIFFFMDNQIEENTYKYELELRDEKRYAGGSGMGK